MPDDSGTLSASVNGAYGEVTQLGESGEINLTYTGGSNGAQGEYQKLGDTSWSPIPDGGVQIGTSVGEVLQIRTVWSAQEAPHCDKVPPESPQEANFTYTWPGDPTAPSVTIEVREQSIVRY